MPDKVYFLLSIAKAGKCAKEELNMIKGMTSEHSTDMILGRVFGYSISDYAIATLKWLNTDDTLREFKLAFDKLSSDRKNEISELIARKLYLEL